VTWFANAPGVLRLPSGRLIRGRRAGGALPAGPVPEWALLLSAHAPVIELPSVRWLQWPDFWLPTDRADAADAFAEALRRSDTDRVEVACHGGRGRTGTALACIAVLDGVPPAQAVAFVRAHYDRRAIETPWQRRYVSRFRAS
jgi:hypothetical protein